MPAALDPSLYYLANFRTALAWIGERYSDLLDAEDLEWSGHVYCSLFVRARILQGGAERGQSLGPPPLIP